MSPESSDIGNVMGNVARKVGVAEAVLRLMVGLLTGLPLAFVYRSFCYKRNATIQHIFITICGVWLAFFCFGWSCLHSLVNIILAYLLLQLGGPQALTVILMFVLNVGYLITGYAFKSYSQDYSVSWTTAHCVLCLRLTVYSGDSDALCNGSFSHHVKFYNRFYDMFTHKISTRVLFVNGLAWDYYDGNQDQEKLSEDFRKTAICDCPTLLQIASYTYFFGGFLVGPQFPMKKYLLLIEGNLIDKNDDVSVTRITAGLRRFGLGLIYLTMYSVLQPKVKESFLVTDEYDQNSFLYKLCYAIATTKVFVMKYQAVWLITEGSCIISGLGYNGRSEDGRDRWDGCSNVHLLLFETAYTFQHVIDAFNLNTNQWMFRYLYKRLRFLGNKLISHFITLAFVALWHGVAPGFFLCFFGEFVIIVMEQQLLGLCRRVVQRPFSSFPLAIRIPIILLGVCVRLTGVAFFLIPFLLRRLDYTHKVWLSLYYMGPVVLLCWFILYPTILMPMTRRFSKKPRTELTPKKLNETLKEE